VGCVPFPLFRVPEGKQRAVELGGFGSFRNCTKAASVVMRFGTRNRCGSPERAATILERPN
jgi:hypothetical protein